MGVDCKSVVYSKRALDKLRYICRSTVSRGRASSMDESSTWIVGGAAVVMPLAEVDYQLPPEILPIMSYGEVDRNSEEYHKDVGDLPGRRRAGTGQADVSTATGLSGRRHLGVWTSRHSLGRAQRLLEVNCNVPEDGHGRARPIGRDLLPAAPADGREAASKRTSGHPRSEVQPISRRNRRTHGQTRTMATRPAACIRGAYPAQRRGSYLRA